jgi:hypothetical protein
MAWSSGKGLSSDENTSAMYEAMADELFVSDLNEVMEDFKHADFEARIRS